MARHDGAAHRRANAGGGAPGTPEFHAEADSWPDAPPLEDDPHARYDDGFDRLGLELAEDDDPDPDELARPVTDPASWFADGDPATELLSIDLTGQLPRTEPAHGAAPAAPYAVGAEPGQEAAPEPPYLPAPEHVSPASTPAVVPTHRPDWGIPALPEPPESLGADSVLRHRRPRPRNGWRRRVYAATGGRLNLGPSPAELRAAALVRRARTPIADCHRLAVISLKGGVGKTTTTAALGAMLSQLRGDRVIAVDANPDRGTLGERVPRQSGATVRHLLEHRDQLHRYADVRAFTSQSPTRLEILASDSDPSASLAFSEQDYRNTVTTLERFYNLILTDCGTGLLHDAMRGILGLASSLVVVSSASLDGARSASATLDWLEAHGFGALAHSAVVVISSVRPGGGIVDVLQLEDHFASRCRDVLTIPYDPHLEAGGVLDLEELDDQTQLAYRELAAAIGDGFAT
ncbi:MAG: hypothetical protein QOJ60_2425 [Actinomycetota bacterium]|nr:hypothetical protein [Actinomycetota bacterium]